MNFFEHLFEIKKRADVRVDAELFTGRGFLTWHRRPTYTSSIPITPSNISNTGIVIQGPIRKKNDFTLETARLYRRIYPNAPIVVSTWAGSGYRKLHKFSEIGVKLIELEDAGFVSPGNLARQRATTLAGIEALRSKNLQFLLKTRSDQRIYNSDFLKVLNWYASEFPLAAPQGGLKADARLLFVSMNSFRNRPLSASDFLTYGTVSDSEKYWETGAFDSKDNLIPEQKLLLGYLHKLGLQSQEVSLRSWYIALSSVIGIVDATHLDLFWPKYSMREFLWRRYMDVGLEELGFPDWLMIMSNSELDSQTS